MVECDGKADFAFMAERVYVGTEGTCDDGRGGGT